MSKKDTTGRKTAAAAGQRAVFRFLVTNKQSTTTSASSF
jgi:hypothetical protein